MTGRPIFSPIAATPGGTSSSTTSTTPSAAAGSPSDGYFFLRPHLHFQHPLPYYLAIAVDALLRLSWIVKVTLIYTLVRQSVGGGGGGATG
ncbi:hypothetical protein HK101_000734, partial [Irineochytrium annulatum]